MPSNYFFNLFSFLRNRHPNFVGATLSILLAAPSLAAQVTLQDSENRTISIQQPASRIISLAPHITELFFELGAQDRLVATSEYSDYPMQAGNIERVSGYNSINLERIVALDPDLIIFWGAGNSRSSLDRLLELGYTVYIDDPRTLADIPLAMRNFGMLAGIPEAGAKKADEFTRRLESLRPKFETGDRSVDVFYQVWNDPLQTLNGTHIVSEIIEFCGGRNIFAEEPVIAPVVNLESIIQWNPAVIIRGSDDARQDVWRLEWDKFGSMQAVRDNRLYTIPPEYLQRQTSRILEGVDQMCKILTALTLNSL
jgi:iron complex transport system substrate-binding protein